MSMRPDGTSVSAGSPDGTHVNHGPQDGIPVSAGPQDATSIHPGPQDATPISARRQQTRQRLLDAAAGVFAHTGVAAASVEEICEAAGFTRGAFYSNFESKDDLCFALLRSLADAATSAIRSTLADVDRPPADSAELVDAAVERFLRTQPSDRVSALLLKEMELYALRHPEFARAYQALQDETHALFAQAIGAALDRQGIKLALPIDEAIVMLHAVHNQAQAASLLNPSGPDQLGPQLKTLLAALLR